MDGNSFFLSLSFTHHTAGFSPPPAAAPFSSPPAPTSPNLRDSWYRPVIAMNAFTVSRL